MLEEQVKEIVGDEEEVCMDLTMPTTAMGFETDASRRQRARTCRITSSCP